MSGRGSFDLQNRLDDYKDFINHITGEIETHSSKIDDKTEWLVNVYLDASHSGLAIEVGKEWAQENGA